MNVYSGWPLYSNWSMPVSGRVNDVHGDGSAPAGAITGGHAWRQPLVGAALGTPVQIDVSTESPVWVYTGSCAGFTKVGTPLIMAVAKGTLTAGAGVAAGDADGVGVADGVAVAEGVGVADGVAVAVGNAVTAGVADEPVGTEGYRFVDPVQAASAVTIALAPRETKSRVAIDYTLRKQ
jgi:hypothetical protein